MTRRANIEQAINHVWLKLPTRPESAAGGDVRSSRDFHSKSGRDGDGEQKPYDPVSGLSRTKTGYPEAEGQPLRSIGDYRVKISVPNSANMPGSSNLDNIQDLTSRLSNTKERVSPR